MKKYGTVIGLLGTIIAVTAVWALYGEGREDASLRAMRSALSPEAYEVMYRGGTERPFSSPLNAEHRRGTYVTADTGLPVYRSEDKYDSGTGWPSFTKPIEGSVVLREDFSLLGKRIEVVSADTGAHLGHVFDDGPLPLGKRWCMNGVALRFVPDEESTFSTRE